jgi:heterodisulfide reductase subunit B2
MNIGFYPGCSLQGTAREYNESVKAIAEAFDIELKEIEDWNCCGASAAHSVNKGLSLALPARILALAELQGFDEVVVPCAACFNRLAVAQYELNEDEKKKAETEKAIEMTFQNKVKIINVIQFIDKYIKDKIVDKMTRKFEHKVACYYGCLLVRPHKIIGFDRVEDPTSMDELMTMIGATSLDWGFKTECCGASLSIARTDLVAKLSGNIMKDASERGVEAVIVACPMCHSNLDMRRPQIDEYVGKEISTPVIYITQAIGLAVGVAPEKLGLQRHFVKVNTL